MQMTLSQNIFLVKQKIESVFFLFDKIRHNSTRFYKKRQNTHQIESNSLLIKNDLQKPIKIERKALPLKNKTSKRKSPSNDLKTGNSRDFLFVYTFYHNFIRFLR